MCEKCETSQKGYDDWSLHTPKNEIQRLNAPSLNDVEIELILRSNPKKVLDVGCGDGMRLFNYLNLNDINFIGIEKFDRLYHESPFANNIINGDVTETIPQIKDIDTITILGGSLCGILCYDCQKTAWENISSILPINKYVIFDTPFLEGFKTSESIGLRNFRPGIFPPQFFLSEKQLKSIWEELNLRIVETKEHLILNLPLKYYLLQKTK